MVPWIPLLVALVIYTLIAIVAAYIVQGVRFTSILPAFVVGLLFVLIGFFTNNLFAYSRIPGSPLLLFIAALLIASLFQYLLSLILPGFIITKFKNAFLFCLVVAAFAVLLQVLVALQLVVYAEPFPM